MSMMTSRLAFVWGLVLIFATGMAAAQEPRPPTKGAGLGSETPAREALNRALATLHAEQGRVLPVTDAAVTRAFPGCIFYVVRFPQYPVAFAPPAPLAVSNLFVVRPDGTVAPMTTSAALEAFFRAHLTPVTTEPQARTAVQAWLRLAPELRQDGFFQFAIPGDAIHAGPIDGGGWQVTGKAVVVPRGGNRGEIAATLTFDTAGALTNVSEVVRLTRGIRPICQATKLLDPDPIVRAMAEQALLAMGTAAEEYLVQVRATAPPELRRAIDRIWLRIRSEGP
jgi:hypothetical protein